MTSPKTKKAGNHVSIDMTGIQDDFDLLKEECAKLAPWAPLTNAAVIRFAVLEMAKCIRDKVSVQISYHSPDRLEPSNAVQKHKRTRSQDRINDL